MAGVCTLDDIKAVAPPGSSVLDNYLERVYGAPVYGEEARSWDWDTADVIWLCHLPERIRKCRWPTSPRGLGSIFVYDDDTSRPHGWLWRYTHPTYCHCCKMYSSPAFHDQCHPELGGPRQRPITDEEGFWVEVTHAFIRSNLQPFERDALWFYRARGSGTWYFTGRTLVASDTSDLAMFLNRSLEDGYANIWAPANSTNKINKAQTLGAIRRLGYHTIILTHHLDPDSRKFSGRAFYKVEVIGLRPHIRFSCPPDSANIAWGWNARWRGCECVPTTKAPICHLYKTVQFPFGNVFCETRVNVSSERERACSSRTLNLSNVTFTVADCERPPATRAERASGQESATSYALPKVTRPTCANDTAELFRKFVQPDDHFSKEAAAAREKGISQVAGKRPDMCRS